MIEGFAAMLPAERTTSTSRDDQESPVPNGPAIPLEETTVEPLSKKARKKAAKATRFAEQKAERRAREKERKKLKRATAQPEPHDEDVAVPQPKRARVDLSPQTRFGARLVIDLGFDDKMTEKVPNMCCRPVAVFSRSHTGSDILVLPTRVHLQCK